MALVDNAFTTVALLERFMSVRGADQFAAHTDGAEAEEEVKEDAINSATEEMAMYLTQRYNKEDLADHTGVQRWATSIAAYFLTIVRGLEPPESWAAEFKRLMDPEKGIMARIAAGELKIDGLSLRSDMRPTMSNLRVVRRFNHSKIRVTRPNSTDQPSVLPRKFDDGSYIPDV